MLDQPGEVWIMKVTSWSDLDAIDPRLIGDFAAGYSKDFALLEVFSRGYTPTKDRMLNDLKSTVASLVIHSRTSNKD